MQQKPDSQNIKRLLFIREGQISQIKECKHFSMYGKMQEPGFIEIISLICTLAVQGILQARILEWLSFPSPEDLADPGIEHRSPALWLVSLSTEPQGKPLPALC